MSATTEWADSNEIRWAFTDRNAGATYTAFYKSRADLGRVDWKAVSSLDFRDPVVKDGKQAEFLIHGSFPWSLVERIGVLDRGVAREVETILADAEHHPQVTIKPGWYY